MNQANYLHLLLLQKKSKTDRVLVTDLPKSAACLQYECKYWELGRCEDMQFNRRQLDAACNRATNTEILPDLIEAELTHMVEAVFEAEKVCPNCHFSDWDDGIFTCSLFFNDDHALTECPGLKV